MDSTDKSPPAEAVLIKRARQAQGLSPERIVERLTRITMTGRNWRQIEDGRGAPDETIAHMAFVVGVQPDELAATGREEAAEILAAIKRQELIEPDDDPELLRLIRQAEQERAEGDPTLYKMLLRLQGTSTGPQRKPGSRDDGASGGTQQVS